MNSVKVIENLQREVEPLKDAFEKAGKRLYLVGGVVRDLFLGGTRRS